MKIALMAAISVLGMVQAADAQDGFYYGIGLGVTESSTNAPIVSDYTATATDLSLALTAGYRFAASGNLQFGIEGNLDVLSGETMSDGADACTGQSPSWCTLDTVLRLRGTVTTELANGGHLTSSLGAVLVDGVTENGGGNYLDTTGKGLSLGFGWEPATMPVRIDVNYDAIRDDDQPLYERDLDLIGLRASYMF